MARAAFIVDRVMHRFGLHGRSFVPLMTGFGCSIPGIMATRTMEKERDRLTTMFVVPLMSCGARLPIWMLLVPAFFPPRWRAPALWGIYIIGIVLALLVAHALLVMADSGTLTAGLVGTVPPELRGAALGMYSLAGFAGGMIGPSLFGFALDVAGGQESATAWVWSYLAIGAGGLAAPMVARTLGRAGTGR